MVLVFIGLRVELEILPGVQFGQLDDVSILVFVFDSLARRRTITFDLGRGLEVLLSDFLQGVR